MRLNQTQNMKAQNESNRQSTDLGKTGLCQCAHTKNGVNNGDFLCGICFVLRALGAIFTKSNGRKSVFNSRLELVFVDDSTDYLVLGRHEMGG